MERRKGLLPGLQCRTSRNRRAGRGRPFRVRIAQFSARDDAPPTPGMPCWRCLASNVCSCGYRAVEGERAEDGSGIMIFENHGERGCDGNSKRLKNVKYRRGCARTAMACAGVDAGEGDGIGGDATGGDEFNSVRGCYRDVNGRGFPRAIIPCVDGVFVLLDGGGRWGRVCALSVVGGAGFAGETDQWAEIIGNDICPASGD